MTRTSTIDEQLSEWTAQRDVRIEHDDDLTASRSVEHFASFRRRAAAETAAEALQAAGFEVVIGRRAFKTMLEATRAETLGDGDVEAFLTVVVGVIESSGGDYDGWGALIVESGAEPRPAPDAL